MKILGQCTVFNSLVGRVLSIRHILGPTKPEGIFNYICPSPA